MNETTKLKGTDVKGGLSSRLLLVAAGLLTPLLLILVIELLLAVFDVGRDDHLDDPFVGFEGSLSLFEMRGDHYETRQSRLAWFNHERFSVSKDEKLFRVFTLGGSTTYGRPYDSRASFSNWLELLLNKSNDREVEVINAGGVSYASYRVAEICEEVLAYDPDLLIVYTGHNEFLEKRTYSNLISQPAWVRESRGLLGRLRLFKLLRETAFEAKGDTEQTGKVALSDEVVTRLDRWQGMDDFRRDVLQEDQTLEHYGLNLRRMVRLAKRANVPIIFVTPASNVRDFSPFKSEHLESVEVADRLLVKGLLERGKQALTDGAFSAAEQPLKKAVTLDESYAASWYALGQYYLGVGAQDDARRAFERALVEDVCPLRAPQPFIEKVREVTSDEGVALIDLVAYLEGEATSENRVLPGDDAFLDHVHPQIWVHQRLAEKLALNIFEQGLLTGSLPETSWLEATYEEVEAGFDPDYLAEKDLNLSKVLGWAGKIDEAAKALARVDIAASNHSAMIFQAGLLAEKQGRLEEAKLAYERVVSLEPSMMQAHLNLGRVLLSQGESEGAIQSLREARRIQPDVGEVRLSLARAFLDEGRMAEARAELKALIAVAPDLPGRLGLEGRILQKEGRFEEAETRLAENVVANPGLAGSHFDLAVVRGLMGNLKAAAQGFEEALRLDMNMGAAWRNLGQARVGLNDPTGAEEAFKQALELDDGDALAMGRLADLYRRQGRMADAALSYEKALTLDQNDAHSLINLGLIQAQSGQLNEGIENLERALSIRNGDGALHYNMAQLLLQAGREAEAKGHLRLAEAMGIRLKPELKALIGGR